MTGSIPALAARPVAAPGVTARPILEIRDLRTQFDTDAGIVRAVDGVSFHVMPGETLGIVGESGSGKSITTLSVMKLLPERGHIAGGEIMFGTRNILRLSAPEMSRLRGRDIAMVFQDPMTSLNPVRRISRQLVETMLIHGRRDRKSALRHAIRLLGSMGLPAPERAISAYPHQFSGGMRQRVMLAMGFSNEPTLLLADEPTTALDITVQAQILDLLRELNVDFNAAIILISHDLGVIANVCKRVLVMYAGEVVEEGPTETLLADPRHPYTWALLNAAPRLDRYTPGQKRLPTIDGTPPDPLAWPPGCRFAPRCPFRVRQCDEHPALLPVGDGRHSRCWVTQAGGDLPRQAATVPAAAAVAVPATAAVPPILEVKDLIKHFPLRRRFPFGPRPAVHAVDGVDLTVGIGETVGLVGESGSGKSTLARLIVRIQRPDSGTIRLAGHDISTASRAKIRPLRRRMQMIFQDPYTSLNGRMTVGEILAEPLRFHGITAGAAATRARVTDLLGLVGLSPGAAAKYPHEFSGGQRQRISIARALAVSPDFIVADEPVSLLDVNIQGQIINLLVDLQAQLNLTYLVIGHDLSVVRHVSDRIVVLYLGRIMEVAPAGALFARPLHPYTRALISAVPIPDVALERARQRIIVQGEPPSPTSPPSGCRFRTRCQSATDYCAREVPQLIEVKKDQWVACHYAGQI